MVKNLCHYGFSVGKTQPSGKSLNQREYEITVKWLLSTTPSGTLFLIKLL